ncbi:MAG: efflux RND transporter periplasmic adaptor subunit [Isosphaeraceae bacterium]
MTRLTDLRNGAFGVRPIELDEVKTRVFGDTAVVTSRIKIAGHPTPGRMTNVYVRRQGRWQCVASHASGIVGIGVICPVAGPSTSSTWTEAIRVGALRGQTTRPGNLGNNCIVCHVTSDLDRAPRRTALGGDVDRLDPVTIVQPQFACRVERIYVKSGEGVWWGEPLLQVCSKELAQAKPHYQSASSQWIEFINDEAQSRLTMHLAKEKLQIYGLTEDEIKHISNEDDQARPRFILRARVDGLLTKVAADIGKDYNASDVLMMIQPTSNRMKWYDTRFAPTQ